MTTSPSGYYQHPILYKDHIFFVSEGDIWHLQEKEETPRRISTGLGAVHSLAISPDGTSLAFTGTIYGQREVYVMDAAGSEPKRLTYLNANVEVLAFYDHDHVLIRSDHESAFRGVCSLYKLQKDTRQLAKLPFGFANFVSYGSRGDTFIQRHGYGYATWQRYRGGAAGQIWAARKGKSWQFSLLLSLSSNTLRPLWVQNRLYFLSDHEGKGQLYSCNREGVDIQCHTEFQEFYVKNHSSDGKRIIYQNGGNLWIYDPALHENKQLEFIFHSVRPKRTPTFVCPRTHLSSYDVSPEGKSVILTTRGRTFEMCPWRGPVQQLGVPQGLRYRLACFINNETKIAVRDEGQQERLELWKTPQDSSTLLQGDWGRILDMKPSPQGDFLVLRNQRHALLHYTFKTKKLTPIDQSKFGPLRGFDISSDGHWVVYSIPVSHTQTILRLYNTQTKKKTDISSPLYHDISPAFDPLGRYIYFLSQSMYADESPALFKPYLIILQKKQGTPFTLPPDRGQEEDKKEKNTGKKAITIDLADIEKRHIPFPIIEGRYLHLEAGFDKIFLLKERDPLGHADDEDTEPTSPFSLEMYDMGSLRQDSLIPSLTTLCLSLNREWMAYTTKERQLRVIKAGEKPDDNDSSYRGGGWLGWDRVHLLADPMQEWQFMFDEAWRLQKEMFWREDMGDVDWDHIHTTYRPLVNRIGTTAELMDIIAEMQGELKSSHAYIWGYDQGHGKPHSQGLLGATFEWTGKGSWRITDILPGNPHFPHEASPLSVPGVDISPGDLVWAVDSQPVSGDMSPEAHLVQKAGQQIALLISNKWGRSKRTVWLKPHASTQALKYRAWVEAKRAHVHQKSKGKVGYIHIPDMAHAGFEAFYRGYVAEFDRDGLILDVRFNRGGNISSTLLSQLMRKRLGFDQSRHDGRMPYMTDAPQGPMVALCNQFTASDGDMFSHSFKLLGLGPLIGKRTWGGVIGIFPRHPLLDGTFTTQPEYSFWFHDVGWCLENHGAEPDIEVENTPQDEAAGEDSQLERAIQETLKIITQHEKKKPTEKKSGRSSSLKKKSRTK
jgi:tricorn protease